MAPLGKEAMTVLAGTIVERERELAHLDGAAEWARERGARLVLVTGEAGIGKTTLWTAQIDRLADIWAVEHVGGHHTDRSFAEPFQHLAGDLPGRGDTARELAAAVARTCRERSNGGALLLVVEDLHVVDPVAVTALPHLLNELHRDPVLVVATYRIGAHPTGTPHSRAVAELLRHPRVEELTVRPLSVDGVRRLLAADDDAEGMALARRVHERTRGNPFFVRATARAGDGDDIPWSVSEAVLSIVDSLPQEARDLADLLSVAGEPVRPTVLSAASPGWEPAARRLAEIGLGASVGPGRDVRLHHALVAEALLARLGERERAALHRTLATALELTEDSRPGDVEALARHWAAAGSPDRAAPWAGRAADHLLAVGSLVRATELYEVAVDGVPAASASDAGLLERAATAAGGAGRDDLAQRWGAAAADARRIEEGAWTTSGTWANLALMRFLPEPAQASSTPDDDTSSALLVAAQEAVDAGDLPRARHLARQADDRAAAAGDAASRASAALALLYAGDLDGADAVLDDVVRIAEDAGDWATAGVVRSRSSRVALGRGEVGDAIARAAAGLEAGRRTGTPEVWAHLAAGTAFLEAVAGDVRAARRRCEELDSLDLPMVAGIVLWTEVAIALEDGDLDRAQRGLATLVPMVRALGLLYYSAPVLAMAARLDLIEGRAGDALGVIDELERFGISPYHEFGSELPLMRAIALHLLDDDEGAEAARRTLDGHADERPGPNIVASASFASGLWLSATDPPEAATRFEQAADAWERTPRLAAAAEALCEAARCSAASDPARSARFADRASRLARRAGLERVGWRAATLQSSVGTQAPMPRTSNREAVLAGLTPRERELVLLIASGRSNREIAATVHLSEKTVRNNLSNAFAKLGITRRTEVAPLLAGDLHRQD